MSPPSREVLLQRKLRTLLTMGGKTAAELGQRLGGARTHNWAAISDIIAALEALCRRKEARKLTGSPVKYAKPEDEAAEPSDAGRRTIPDDVILAQLDRVELRTVRQVLDLLPAEFNGATTTQVATVLNRLASRTDTVAKDTSSKPHRYSLK